MSNVSLGKIDNTKRRIVIDLFVDQIKINVGSIVPPTAKRRSINFETGFRATASGRNKREDKAKPQNEKQASA